MGKLSRVNSQLSFRSDATALKADGRACGYMVMILQLYSSTLVYTVWFTPVLLYIRVSIILSYSDEEHITFTIMKF